MDYITEIADSPDEPTSSASSEDMASVFTDVVTDADEPRQKTRRRGRPRKPRINPETGEELPPRPRTPRGPSAKKLEDDLHEGAVKLGTELAPFAPTAAGVWIARAESTAAGLVAVSEGHPRTRALLAKTASATKIAELFTTGLMMFVAFMIDFGKISPDSPLLDNLGYTDLVRDEHGKVQRDENGFAVRTSQTLRDIYDKMHRHATKISDDMPKWDGMSPRTPTGPLHSVPPMNWNSSA